MSFTINMMQSTKLHFSLGNILNNFHFNASAFISTLHTQDHKAYITSPVFGEMVLSANFYSMKP